MSSTGLLRQAVDGFTVMKAHTRARDGLYLIARLYNHLDLVEERNQAAAEFKANEVRNPVDAATPCIAAVVL